MMLSQTEVLKAIEEIPDTPNYIPDEERIKFKNNITKMLQEPVKNRMDILNAVMWYVLISKDINYYAEVMRELQVRNG